ncbi:hypothetical protein ACC755_09790 [Rhizobium ruizarguesonis]|uniref:hypothetical protein n=1 Tax=Rhizobium ruizarguesonis TaxID=2081791 RepID=UPI0013EE780A|nr:hypothetical protein [Rhizobium ruizarguesonis]
MLTSKQKYRLDSYHSTVNKGIPPIDPATISSLLRGVGNTMGVSRKDMDAWLLAKGLPL